MISGPNWARRYGPGHGRLCARPGCGAPAAATLRFQPTQREAWLVALDEARTEGDLCARHAAGLVLPRGWQLHNDLMGDHATADRDPNAPAPPVRRSRSPSIAHARRRRTANSAVPLPGLGTPADSQPRPEPATYPEPESASASASADESEPAPLVAEVTTETSEALAETLDARTPLLRRAFTNVRPEDNNS